MNPLALCVMLATIAKLLLLILIRIADELGFKMSGGESW